MFDQAHSLLPKTATDLARALDILEERLFLLPIEMITKDPLKVSLELLDHLAWESSVDGWDTDWPEQVKRNIVAVSAELHRYKGSPYAIRLALLAFGVEVELVEWWDADGSGIPGTFVARAFVTDPLDGSEELSVTAPVVDAMKAMLNGVSPVSRGWALQLGAKVTAPAYIGVLPLIHITAEARYLVEPPPELSASISNGVLAHTQIKATAITV